MFFLRHLLLLLLLLLLLFSVFSFILLSVLSAPCPFAVTAHSRRFPRFYSIFPPAVMAPMTLWDIARRFRKSLARILGGGSGRKKTNKRINILPVLLRSYGATVAGGIAIKVHIIYFFVRYFYLFHLCQIGLGRLGLPAVPGSPAAAPLHPLNLLPRPE